MGQEIGRLLLKILHKNIKPTILCGLKTLVIPDLSLLQMHNCPQYKTLISKSNLIFPIDPE